MIDFFTNLNQALANFNSLIDKLTSPEGMIVKVDFQLTANGQAIIIEVAPPA